jgi:enoyl-CoA hydratase
MFMEKFIPSPVSDEVLIAIENNVATILLNREKRFNAISADMLSALLDSVNELAVSPDVSAVVLSGAGRAFCVGLDLKEINSENSVLSGDLFQRTLELINALSEFPKPLIGAINGPAFTGGLELALTCDFLYASESATFADTHVLVGLTPGWGLSQKLPRIIGINRARELSLTGRVFGAQEAFAWGLVNKITTGESVLHEAQATAKMMAANSTPALNGIKQLINSGWLLDLQEGLAIEEKLFVEQSESIDLSAIEARLEAIKSR